MSLLDSLHVEIKTKIIRIEEEIEMLPLWALNEYDIHRAVQTPGFKGWTADGYIIEKQIEVIDED